LQDFFLFIAIVSFFYVFLFNLFMKLQEKASWDLDSPLKTKKTAGSAKGLSPVKRTLH
jgi:hypothetical protein